MRADLIAAATAVQAPGQPAEISAVLNRMPGDLLDGPDDRVVDAVDAAMDDLYREGLLVCPGHRWLPGPPPSIRGHLVGLHDRGHLLRDPQTRTWSYSGVTSYFRVTPR
jgi:hypothetical protein